MRRVIILLRHLLAIAALPFVVMVVVPVWLTREYESSFAGGVGSILVRIAGLCLLLLGLSLFASSLRRFANDGKGTLAPWDPPRQLVIRGPYRFVRNPMISGVVLILFAEALLFLSTALVVWALVFFAINATYIPLLEEPQLRRRFGAAYIEYCNHVPRLVPRLKPWIPGALRPLP